MFPFFNKSEKKRKRRPHNPPGLTFGSIDYGEGPDYSLKGAIYGFIALNREIPLTILDIGVRYTEKIEYLAWYVDVYPHHLWIAPVAGALLYPWIRELLETWDTVAQFMVMKFKDWVHRNTHYINQLKRLEAVQKFWKTDGDAQSFRIKLQHILHHQTTTTGDKEIPIILFLIAHIDDFVHMENPEQYVKEFKEFMFDQFRDKHPNSHPQPDALPYRFMIKHLKKFTNEDR